MTAVDQPASVSCLIPLLTPESGDDPVDAAVIITEAPCDPMLGTLLAGHFPSLPIYAYSHDATELPDVASIVGRLHTFRLTMDLPPGHSLDVWERAAMLIHNRYVAEFPSSSPAAEPGPSTRSTTTKGQSWGRDIIWPPRQASPSGTWSSCSSTRSFWTSPGCPR